MFKENAEQLLQQYAQESYPKQRVKINDRIHLMVGYGHSNVIIIEGDQSLILIDSLESNLRAKKMMEEFATISQKPVKTIIYTHGHPDHRGGSGAFKDTVEEIIAFAPGKPAYKHGERLKDVFGQRTGRQFGYGLSDEEVITQGLGIREGGSVNEGTYEILPPTTIYNQEQVELTIDGIPMVLVLAMGETDDQIFVWLPEDKVLCCGDNYYGCWPNLYAIRGGQYRDIAAWVDSLETILSYPAEALLPGHTRPIIGYDNIQEVLGNYKGAIEYVLLQSLDLMNQGFSEDEVVAGVKLPEQYQDKPYLGEFYGTIEWSVRSIYNGYFGWFDGNPTNLGRLPMKEYARGMIELIGDERKIIETIKNALDQKQFQWAVELCDLLIQGNKFAREAKEYKAQGLLGLSKLITSANGRHYYITCAKELVSKK